jgi:tetratricopeptide (TPR) repeat protein
MKKKMRLSLIVASVVCLGNAAFAQTVEQGKMFLYYHRYKSANDLFDKILASNPNNIDAIYWKGQGLFDTKDSAAAGDLYSKALQTNGSAPLLLVGMGGFELRMGKTADAKQRFETAIGLTKAKDINVLNAIADNCIDAPAGDAQYAIDKLTLATQIKNFHDATTYVLMGDAYRKLIDGGNAVTSYQKALSIDPKLAEAKYKIGKIYLTQNNKEYFLPAFEESVQMDPAYAPAYYELFYYWYFRDVNKAGDYLDKYIANSDPGPEVEYLKTDFLYASSKFGDAKTKAQGLITSLGDKVSPRMYKMIAYCCDTLGDLPCATQNITTYFAKQVPGDVLPADYEERAHINGKSTDSVTANSAFPDYFKAIQLDTLPDNKTKYAAEATVLAKKLGNKKAIADLAQIAYLSKKNPTNTDIYNWGFANYSAGNYKTADSIFCGIYESAYPNEFFGYFWCKNARLAEDDSLWSQGLPIEAYQKLAVFCRNADSVAKVANSPDSIKYKKYIIEAYSQLAGFYNNVKKDKETAIFYLKQWLEVDPTSPDAQRFLAILSRPARQPAKPGTGTKPKSSGK